jgi:exopolysaccharide biosynthesis polyprenyl glycosylphosphotransferase
MDLQRRAPRNLQRHLERATVRLLVLVTTDLGAFALLRELYRAVGDGEALGPIIARPIETLLPAGYLDGWQYAAALVIGLFVTGNYGPGDARRAPKRLLAGCLLATALPLWAALWHRGLGLVAAQYAVTTSIVWLALVAVRSALDLLDARVVGRAPASSRTVLVGPAEACRALGARRAFAPRGEHTVLGYVDTAAPAHPTAIGSLIDLPALIQRYRVESVVVCGHLADADLGEVVERTIAAGCHVFAVPRAFEVAGVQPSVLWKRNQPLVELSAQTLKAQQFAVKRVVDVVGASLGLVLLAPLFLAAAALIKLDSRGPVLYRQRRTGLGGRPFRILKFRTMQDGAHAQQGDLKHLSRASDPRIFKMPADPRVSRVGRWLRRWAIDELPQLWNVLTGEMSLVGPRPFVETDLGCYQLHHFSRFGAKPGITGLWQVRRNSDTVDFEEVMALDTQYIREWSLLLDGKILLLTLPAVIRGRGAV